MPRAVPFFVKRSDPVSLIYGCMASTSYTALTIEKVLEDLYRKKIERKNPGSELSSVGREIRPV
jgi:hypothetical protein